MLDFKWISQKFRQCQMVKYIIADIGSLDLFAISWISGNFDRAGLLSLNTEITTFAI